MIRHINKFNSESWEFLPWKKFWINLFRLQKRVYKAIRAGDTQKARSLQKLIIRVEVSVTTTPLPSETRRETFTSSGYSTYFPLSVGTSFSSL